MKMNHNTFFSFIFFSSSFLWYYIFFLFELLLLILPFFHYYFFFLFFFFFCILLFFSFQQVTRKWNDENKGTFMKQSTNPSHLFETHSQNNSNAPFLPKVQHGFPLFGLLWVTKWNKKLKAQRRWQWILMQGRFIWLVAKRNKA